jgi:hypothetical protein
MTHKIIFILFFLLFTNLNSSSLDKGSGLILSLGYGNWSPASVKNFFHSQQSFNYGILTNLPFPSIHPFTQNFNTNVDTSNARTPGIGYIFGSKGGGHRGKLFLNYTYTGNEYFSNSVFTKQSMSQNDFNLGIHQYSMNSIQKGTLQYDHDIYLLPDARSNFLNGLGIKIGLMAQYDFFNGKYTPFNSNGTIQTRDIGVVDVKIPIQFDIKYRDPSAYTLIGLVYRFALGNDHEFEINPTYYNGKGRMKSTISNISLVNISQLSIPIENDYEYRARMDIIGMNYYFGYTYKVTRTRFINLFYQYREFTHTPSRIDVKISGVNPLVQSLGMYRAVKDLSSTIGIQFIVKF